MYKQIIIARKDLHMSDGKLAAQVSHASMAFLIHWMNENHKSEDQICGSFDNKIYENWINTSVGKVVLGAKNKNQLLKAVSIAKTLGMSENKDFFLIYDACNTELIPEEIDKEGNGKTLTCIGFIPMENQEIDKISKKYSLY